MPSSMIHLLAARLYEPGATPLFFIGNLAPDAYPGDYKGKDRTHFRDRADREKALREYALSHDLTGDFHRGVVMHLYLDLHWDREAMEKYKAGYTDFSWVAPYRNEISTASKWLYSRLDWSEKLWEDMKAVRENQYGEFMDTSSRDIHDFLVRNHEQAGSFVAGPSDVYPPEYVEEFCSRMAVWFREWLEEFR